MASNVLLIMVLQCSLCAVVAHAEPDTSSVYFSLGDSKLSDEAVRTLDLAMYGGSISERQPLQLIGYADEIGDARANLQLSRRRTEAVQQYLLKSGFRAERITLITAKGEQGSANVAGPAGNRADRRVDIVSASLNTAAPATPVPVPAPAQKNERRTLANTDIRTVAVGKTLLLENINFQGGSHHILKESCEAVEALLQAMQSAPNVRIRIEGHICCPDLQRRASDEVFGIKLSIARARSIYDYLVDRGIAAERLDYTGFGSSRLLISPEKNEADRVANRRVEIRIIK